MTRSPIQIVSDASLHRGRASAGYLIKTPYTITAGHTGTLGAYGSATSMGELAGCLMAIEKAIELYPEAAEFEIVCDSRGSLDMIAAASARPKMERFILHDFNNRIGDRITLTTRWTKGHSLLTSSDSIDNAMVHGLAALGQTEPARSVHVRHDALWRWAVQARLPELTFLPHVLVFEEIVEVLAWPADEVTAAIVSGAIPTDRSSCTYNAAAVRRIGLSTLQPTRANQNALPEPAAAVS